MSEKPQPWYSDIRDLWANELFRVDTVGLAVAAALWIIASLLNHKS